MMGGISRSHLSPAYAEQWMDHYRCSGSSHTYCLGCKLPNCPAHGEYVWSKGLKVLVTGGRKYKDRDTVMLALNMIDGGLRGVPLSIVRRIKCQSQFIGCIIQGQCHTGADRWAREWADTNRKHCPSIYTPDWDEAERLYGNRLAAGPIRNKRMVDSKPDLCIYFPGGKGTEGTVRLAREARITTIAAEDLIA